MKNILNIKRGGAIALAIFCLLALSLRAHAQEARFGYNTVGGLPLTVPAATTTNFPVGSRPFIDASKQDKVAFMFFNSWSTAGETTGNTNILYVLAPSIDGTIMDTNKTITLAAYNRSGTAGVSSPSSTNVSANGMKGWFIVSAANNSAAGVATNPATAITYSVKINAP